MEMIKVYYLEHPEKNVPVYIGTTIGSLSARLKDHNEKIHGKDLCSKLALQLHDKGLKFLICQLDEVPLDEWRFWKHFWMDQFRAWGFELLNRAMVDRDSAAVSHSE